MLTSFNSPIYWCSACRHRTGGYPGPNGQECFVCKRPLVRLDFCSTCQLVTSTNPCVKCGGEVLVSYQLNTARLKEAHDGSASSKLACLGQAPK